MIKAGIIGATGYAGVELLRLLLSHPNVEVAAISSVSFEGKPISEIYPSLYQIDDMTLGNQEDVIAKCDVVFASLPHGLSEEMGKKCFDAGKVFIDLGADFRLDSADVYTKWYNKEYNIPDIHKESVYGLCEIFRDEIKKHKLVGNPGCYPTSAALALAPALKGGFIETKGIIVDSKSGTTGAGRGLAQNLHYADCNESFAPYKVANHRHTPEIEQTLSKIAGEDVKITFVPHLLPINRGIVSTIYADMKGGDFEAIYKYYVDFYKNERFVRVLPLGKITNLKEVRMSNYCDISLFCDKEAGKLIIVSAIDNMVKGAAGQAIQNMNIICGFDEAAGLTMIPPAF